MRFVRVLLTVVLVLSLLLVPDIGSDDEVSAYVGWMGAGGTQYDGTAPQQNNEINVSKTLSDSYISSDTCMVLDSQDRPHIVWCESVGVGPSANYDVFYVYWDGSDWCCIDDSIYDPNSPISPNPANVSDTDHDSCMATIALDGNDNPHIAWSDITYGVSSEYDIFYVYWDDTDSRWEDADGNGYHINPSLANVSKNDGYSFDPRIALDASGTPFIAWTDESYGHPEIMCVQWGSTSWENMLGDPYNPSMPGIANVSNNREQSRHCSLKLDSSGNPHLVWHDNTYPTYYSNAEVLYVHWVYPDWVGADDSLYDPTNPSPGWEPAPDINVSRTSIYDSRFASLALDEDDNPHIVWEDLSYYYINPFEVLYVRWSDLDSDWVLADGSTYNPSMPANANVSMNLFDSSIPNISLDSSGYPCITWYDESYNLNEEIIFIRWNGSQWTNQPGSAYDPIAGNANVSQSDDSSALPNVALDSNDYPHLAWVDTSFSGGTADVMFVEWGVVEHDGVFSISKDVDANSDGVFGDNGVRALDGYLDYRIEWNHVSGEDPVDNLYIYDTIPFGTFYHSSSPTANLSYSTDGGTSWIPGEPSPPSSGYGGDIVRWGPFESQFGWQGANGSLYDGSVTAQPMDINVSRNVYDSSHADIEIDSNEYPHITWSDPTFGNDDIYYVKWDGNEWITADGSTYDPVTGNANISKTPGYSGHHMLKLDSNDNPHIAWHDSSHSSGDSWYVEWSSSESDWVTADGSIYDPVVGNANVSRNGLWVGVLSLALDSLVKPHLAWELSHNEIIYVHWSDVQDDWLCADGNPYNPADSNSGNVSSNPGLSKIPSLALNKDDHPCIVWADYTSYNWEIYYVRWNGYGWECANGDNYGTTPVNANVSCNSSYSYAPCLVLDNMDNAHIAWHDDEVGNDEIYYVHWSIVNWECANGDDYSVIPSSANVSNNSSLSFNPSLAINNMNEQFITWFDDSLGNTDIYYVYWSVADWKCANNHNYYSNPSSANVTNNSGSSDYPALALDSSSNPHIAWLDDTSGNNETYYVHYPASKKTFNLRVEIEDCTILGSGPHYINNRAYFDHAYSTNPDYTDVITNLVICPFWIETERYPIIEAKKTANTSMAAVGDIVHYTIILKNTGNGNAENIVVTDILPRELQFISSNIPGSFVGNSVEFRIDLAAGESKSIRISCRIRDDMNLRPGDVLTNIATVTGVEKPLSTNMGVTIKSSNPGCEIPQMELRMTDAGKPGVIMAGKELDCEMLAHAGCNPFDVSIHWDDGKKPYIFIIGDSMVHKFNHTFETAGDYLVEVHVTGAYGKMTNLYKHVHVIPATE